MHAFGLPIEPYGWDLQLAYTLALIRADKVKPAVKELRKVESKVLKYKDRTRIQLCELLHALIALHEEDINKDKTYYNAVNDHEIELNNKVKLLAERPEFRVFK